MEIDFVCFSHILFRRCVSVSAYVCVILTDTCCPQQIGSMVIELGIGVVCGPDFLKDLDHCQIYFNRYFQQITKFRQGIFTLD